MAKEFFIFVFALIEIFEPFRVLAGKVRKAIREIEVGLCASDCDKEDADFLVGGVAGVADMFEVTR